jgi:hypothetical protein
MQVLKTAKDKPGFVHSSSPRLQVVKPSDGFRSKDRIRWVVKRSQDLSFRATSKKDVIGESWPVNDHATSQL